MAKYLRNYISIYIMLLLGLCLNIYSVIEYIYFKPFVGTLTKGIIKKTEWIRNMKSYEIEFQDSKGEIYSFSTLHIYKKGVKPFDSIEVVYHEDNPKEVRINAKLDLSRDERGFNIGILFGCSFIITGTYGLFRYTIRGEETPENWRLF